MKDEMIIPIVGEVQKLYLNLSEYFLNRTDIDGLVFSVEDSMRAIDRHFERLKRAVLEARERGEIYTCSNCAFYGRLLDGKGMCTNSESPAKVFVAPETPMCMSGELFKEVK